MAARERTMALSYSKRKLDNDLDGLPRVWEVNIGC